MQFFIEQNDVKLQSALSFSQYNLPLGNINRLITIIGEQHERSFKCAADAKQISITDYALRILSLNPRSQVLLEIDPSFIETPNLWPNSTPIRGILSNVITKPELLARIQGYDWRNYWLGAQNREILYHYAKTFLDLDKGEIILRYLNPLVEKWDLFSLVKEHYDDGAYRYLSTEFLQKLHHTHTYIHSQVMSTWDKSITDRQKILEMIRHLWKEVTDWKMLSYFFLISDTDSIISIMGEQHRKNLAGIFSHLPLLAEQKGEEGKCVSLFRTVNNLQNAVENLSGQMSPKNRGNCYASMNEEWLRSNKWLPKGWKSKDVKLPKGGAGLGGGAGAEQRVPGLRKLYYKERQDHWPEWKLEDLPKGWKAVPSNTRPGQLTFVNKLTGERISYFPTVKASSKANNLPRYMPRRKLECIKDRYKKGDEGGIWYDDTCYYSQKPIAQAKKYLPPVFLTDINTYCEEVDNSKKCDKSEYRHINKAIFGHVPPEGLSTIKYPCKWKDDEESENFLSPRKSRGSKSSKKYRWMSYSQAASYIPEAKKAKVSKVARGIEGFMGVYKNKKNAKTMANAKFTATQTWGQRRNAFIKRHMAQYKKNPTRRRWLALAMWAYKPRGSMPKD